MFPFSRRYMSILRGRCFMPVFLLGFLHDHVVALLADSCLILVLCFCIYFDHISSYFSLLD